MIIARYDVILDQSERALLYNQLSNYTKSNDYYKLLLLLVGYGEPIRKLEIQKPRLGI